MAKEPKETRYGVGSVDIAIRMLKVLADFRRPVSLTEMARELHVSPGKVHRYFVSFLRGGLIAKQPETGKYELGALSLRVGLCALEQIDAVRFASEGLSIFRDENEITVLLAVWGEVGPVVIRMEESKDRVKMNVRVGSVLPVLTSAIGRVFMSYLAAGQANALIKHEQQKRASVAKLPIDKIVTEVRRHGASRIDSYGLPGVTVLAAPILDHQGHIAAVVAALSLKEVDRLTMGGAISIAVRHFANDVSERLGYHPPTPSPRRSSK